MAVADRLMPLLPGDVAGLVARYSGEMTELRLRAGRPVHVVGAGFDILSREPLDGDALRRALSALMDYSVYARQAELDRGYFTLDDGSRVGVCGRVFDDGGGRRMGEIGSICVRVCRAVPGCADALAAKVAEKDGLRSLLLVSPPGMGKTTLLRDIARQLSEAGYCVGVADERHELAACRQGVPTLDLGPRTDVMDGCPRPDAIRALLRTMAPRLIVADEIGGPGDAEALADAARCGVAVAASAHGESLEAALSRPALRSVAEAGTFRLAALLGPKPGMILEIRELR